MNADVDQVPKRVQLRRTKGWRKPEGAMVVARPSVWGNPYRVGDGNPITGGPIVDRAEAVELFRRMNGNRLAWIMAARRELGGKDLACWCPLDEPCHADWLLELANLRLTGEVAS